MNYRGACGNARPLNRSVSYSYFVVLNTSTEEVDYGHLWDALD